MGILWTGPDLSVRDVQERLRRPAAYTTVMTTLDRLYKKGALNRHQVGRAFVYSAAITEAGLRARIAGGVIAGLVTSRDEAAVPILSNLVESVGQHDDGPELLRRLEEMVREKRRELSKDR